MNLLEMTRHYTSALRWLEIKRVLAKWEKYSRVTWFGYDWEGAYIIETNKGQILYFWGYWNSGEAWNDESRVSIKYYDSIKTLLENEQHDWKPFLLERTE